MEIEFRELRKHEVAEAVAFAVSHGCYARAEDVLWTKSVVAWKGGNFFACALVISAPLNQDRIYIASCKEAEGSESIVALLDKVTHKLHHHGTQKTRFFFANSANRHQSMTQTHWVGSFASTPWQKAQNQTNLAQDCGTLNNTQALVDALDPGPAAA